MKSIKITLLAFIAFLNCFYGCNNANTLTDIDGNVYKTVKIGDQVWMAENLKVTRYRNGNPILHRPEAKEWSKTTDGAYCYYNNDSSNILHFGNLYNWHAINDSRNLAPEGWHIPSPEEITTLVNTLKGDTVAGGKLKISGAGLWLSPNAGATNESGFSAVPGGYRFNEDGSFHTMGSNGYWWTTTKSYEIFSWTPRLYEVFADVNRDTQYLNYGLAVRCIKD